jgi:hypothetical protein
MMPETDLREAERKTYLSYFDDGIADIAGGLVVLLFGLGMVFGASTLFILSWMPTILFWPLKQVITFPRIGHVKFIPERQRKISRNMILLFIAGTLSLLLGIVAVLGTEGIVFNLRDFMMEYSLLLIGVVMAMAFALIAILFEVRRFFGYALLVFGGWLSSYLLEIEPGAPVAIAGGMIAVIGIVLLVRFVNKYPVPSE